jgi:hypothetical protein
MPTALQLQGVVQHRGNRMAYEDLVLFVSFGWFVSVAVMFIMYVRIRQLSEEVKIIKNTVQLSDDNMLGQDSPIPDST